MYFLSKTICYIVPRMKINANRFSDKEKFQDACKYIFFNSKVLAVLNPENICYYHDHSLALLWDTNIRMYVCTCIYTSAGTWSLDDVKTLLEFMTSFHSDLSRFLCSNTDTILYPPSIAFSNRLCI